MDGQSLLDYIIRTFKRTDKNTEILEAINDTISDMRIRFSLDETKDEAYSTGISVLGSYRIDLPDDFEHMVTDVKILDGDQSYVLKKLSKQEFDDMYPNPNDTNVQKFKPVHYTIFSNAILLGPVPDKTSYQYEFSYSTIYDTPITVSTSDVPFSDMYREALKYGVLFRINVALENDDAAAKWRTFYEEEIVKIVARDKHNIDSPIVMNYKDI